MLSPILVLCCFILKVTGEGEVFYLQQRVARGGRIFHLRKFATMFKDSPNLGTGNITMKDDPRVLPFGKILRLSKLNEIPQLLNILVGDMSVVGPRPVTPDHFDLYSKDGKNAIGSVRPGLSGIGSIFFRSEDEFLSTSDDPVQFYKDIIAPYKEELEIWYIKNKSIKIYFMIIFATLLVVFFPKLNVFKLLFPNAPSAPGALDANRRY